MNQLTVDYRGVQSVMGIDDVLASHPVYIPVHHPKEINEIFDLISYAKVIVYNKVDHWGCYLDIFCINKKEKKQRYSIYNDCLVK